MIRYVDYCRIHTTSNNMYVVYFRVHSKQHYLQNTTFPFYIQDCGQTGPLLAGLLNAPQATFAAKLERGDDGSITVERETDAGESVRYYVLGIYTV